MDLDQTNTPSTTASDLSFGPALEGSVSFTSSENGATQQTQSSVISDGSGTISQEQTTPTKIGPEESGDRLDSDPTGRLRDGPTISEAEEYADNLARELIHDTDQLVREKHSDIKSAAQEAVAEAISTAMLAEKNEDEPVGEIQKIDKSVLEEALSDHENPEEKHAESDSKRTSCLLGNAALYFEQDSLDLNSDSLGVISDVIRSEVSQELVNDDITEPINKPQQSSPEENKETIQADTVEVDAKREVDELEKPKDIMEFTKNYSDDLLMGSTGESRQQTQDLTNQGGVAHDLADFELPPYSGSSGSSNSEQATAPSTSANTIMDNVASSSPSTTDLSAIKNILISLYSKFSHIFHWKKPIESGIFFGIGLTVITALTFFSIISVVAYSALGIITASGCIRIYKAAMKAFNGSPETPVDHIWDKALKLDVSVSPERMHSLVDASHGNLNASSVYFKQVLLVEDKRATFKFAIFLYWLTYIGACFNGLTLIAITYLTLFSVPYIYEKNKTKIDQQLNLAMRQFSSTISMVTGKASGLAFGTQASESSKKRE